jgi:ubiquitin-protein ligase
MEELPDIKIRKFIDDLFPTKPIDKREAWAQVFLNEEYETVSDLKRASEDAWSQIKLPLATKDVIRQELKKLNPVEHVKSLPVVTDNRPLTQLDMVVFDISSSMKSRSFDPDNNRLGSAKILFHAMVDKLVGHELPHALALVLFGQNIRVMPFVRDYEAFHDTLGNAEANENNTKLFDAIQTAGEEIVKFAKENPHLLSTGDEPCKFRIFCLTDGEDNASTHKYWDVAKYLQSHNIVLDAFPLSVVNKILQAMTAATGGLCLNVSNMEKGVALFEREAILHINNREKSDAPLPVITDEQSILNIVKTTKIVEEIKTVQPTAVVTAPVWTPDDVSKAEQTMTVASGPLKRIFKEYKELMNSPVLYWKPYVSAGDTFFWKVIMEGPPGTPYEKGRWMLTLKFPQDYPFKPPDVRFIIPIYHCNINNDGKLCLDILKDKWSPALSARIIFNSITALLITPNPMDALDTVKANVYSDNKDNYNRLATEHKITYANHTEEDLKRTYQLGD